MVHITIHFNGHQYWHILFGLMVVQIYTDKRWSILGKVNLDNVFILVEGEVNTETSADPPVCDEDGADNLAVQTDIGR